MTRRLMFLVVTITLVAATAYAGPEDESYTRLARLSYLEGNVSFQHSSDVDWSSASVNLPIEPGDRVYTGPEGRAEIQFDDGSVLRVAENTDLEILSLRQELIQIRMMVGLATLNLSGDADFEINTPAAAFNAVRNGIYRFDVVENGDTDAIVRKGELEAANNELTRRIRSGELIHFSPKKNDNPEVSEYDRRDAWDEWTDRRNADVKVYGNVRYIPDNVNIGASDLDRYGRWVNDESYGTAWVPYDMVNDWAPYSYGRWCYRPLYGWTWVSYEPWGWLPYHYGRWHRSSIYGWCWIPGPAFSFNFWSPALVAFYNGPGWISWCPLGPGDYYDIGHYHYNRGIYGYQLAQLRGLHSRREGDLFNREARGAFRTAPLDRFRDGSFDQTRNSRWARVDRPWAQGKFVKDRLPVQPTSRSFSAAPDRPAARPREINNLPAVVRNVPAPRDTGRQDRFTRITNPQIPAASPRIFRSRSDGSNETRDSGRANGRTIQAPSNAPRETQTDRQTRRTETPRTQENPSRWSGTETRGRNETRPQPEQRSQPNPQASPRNERSVPEQKPAPRNESAPARRNESAPSGRSDFQGQSSENLARPGIGRWSESNPASTRSGGSIQVIRPSRPQSQPGGVQVYTLPGSRNTERWNNSNSGSVQRSRAPQNVPEYNAAPRSEGRSSWSGSAPEPNSGVTRSEPPRAQERPQVIERGGGNRPSASSSSSGSSGRSAPERRAPREDQGRRGR